MFEQEVCCPFCEEKIIIDFEPYVVSSDVVDKNRDMGDEIEHSIECRGYSCPRCSNKFSVTGSIWEYPTGAYNYHELSEEPD